MLSDDLWRAAVEDGCLPRYEVPVVEPGLGAIAVVRTPDGREFYGSAGWDGQEAHDALDGGAPPCHDQER